MLTSSGPPHSISGKLGRGSPRRGSGCGAGAGAGGVGQASNDCASAVMHGRSAHPCLQVGHANRGKPMSQVSCTPAIADSCDAGSGRCAGQPGMRQSISPRHALCRRWGRPQPGQVKAAPSSGSRQQAHSSACAAPRPAVSSTSIAQYLVSHANEPCIPNKEDLQTRQGWFLEVRSSTGQSRCRQASRRCRKGKGVVGCLSFSLAAALHKEGAP